MSNKLVKVFFIVLGILILLSSISFLFLPLMPKTKEEELYNEREKRRIELEKPIKEQLKRELDSIQKRNDNFQK